jgi:hypothetical protein
MTALPHSHWSNAHISFLNHRPGCHQITRYTATTIGKNSKQPKKTSCVDKYSSKPSAVSANRKHVLRYTASVATMTANAKTFSSRPRTFLARYTKITKQKMKTAKVKT